MALFTVTTPLPNQVFWKQDTAPTVPIIVTGTAQKDTTVIVGTRTTVTVVNAISVKLGSTASARAAIVDGSTNKTWSVTLNAPVGEGQTLTVTASGRQDISDQRTPDVVSSATFSETQTLQVSVRVRTLAVTVTPYPVPTNRAVTVTVSANDLSTGAAVAGQVLVDGKVVGSTNTPFTRTFRTRRVLVSTNPREWEVIYPTGVVQATGYPDTAIDFGFPDL